MAGPLLFVLLFVLLFFFVGEDALDNGQFKQALQLCTKLLKKQEDHAIVKALMGLAYVRMDKKQEALQNADEARLMKPTDEETLQALTYTYKPLNRRKGPLLW